MPESSFSPAAERAPRGVTQGSLAASSRLCIRSVFNRLASGHNLSLLRRNRRIWRGELKPMPVRVCPESVRSQEETKARKPAPSAANQQVAADLARLPRLSLQRAKQRVVCPFTDALSGVAT
ncbi:hypothetical protein MTO96_018318 [Rhipicephalus appendiculatus]